jgi:hypothetical protein
MRHLTHPLRHFIHLLLGLALALNPAPARALNDAVAGAGYAYYPHPAGGTLPCPFLPLMYAAGVRWDRFDFPWPLFEPAPGNWQFAQQDTVVNDIRAAGLNILGILLWTPKWAADGPCTTGLDVSMRDFSLAFADEAPIRRPSRRIPSLCSVHLAPLAHPRASPKRGMTGRPLMATRSTIGGASCIRPWRAIAAGSRTGKCGTSQI